MSGARQRVVVVPGMHRAGTSVVARGLQALGLDLGNALMSADPRMNARGFFEDTELVHLDDELLALHGADWKSVALLAGSDWTRAGLASAHDDARVLLARKLAPTGRFAFKDPRVPRLLPFWQRAFAALDVDDGYVIAVRHPLAVIASLTARDALDPRRSAWLWVTHLVCALRYTQGRPRVVVDYDRLLAAPERELARMAAALALPAPASDSVRAYRDGFLSEDLRHARHEAGDVGEAAAHPLVADAHALAQHLAGDADAGAETAHAAIDALWQRLLAYAPLLDYAGDVERAADDVPRLAGELDWARRSLAGAETYARDLAGTLAARENECAEARVYVDDLVATIARKDTELTAAYANLADAHGLLDRVRERVVGRLLLRAIARKP
ncbi:MAG: hypothetical protein U1F48_02805 [Burkholderiales bacterium]